MALVAGSREDGPDVTSEVDFFFGTPHNARYRRCQAKQKPQEKLDAGWHDKRPQ